jgi:tRNA nucleotidyltransferase (CCA-adding enzyme)
MAKAGHAYPQAAPRAADLVDARVITASRSRTVSRALDAARTAGARVVALGSTAAFSKDLERASSWQLGRLRWLDIAHRDVPSIHADAGEIPVRRRLNRGAPMVLVRAGRRIVGAIEAGRMTQPAPTIAARLERLPGPDAEGRLWVLRAAGKLGEAQGQSTFVAGGFVRDLFLAGGGSRGGTAVADLDLVVEGDGLAFGRRLAEETGGHLVVHASFGTASLEGGATPDGTRLGRIDIASARRERYLSPGALPEVSPAGIEEDLGRRDFSVNAMAVELSPSAWGRLIDPFQGEQDVAARRLRLLSPLSLVEDPTRIFRAARYAARLGLRPDPAFRRALALALRVGRYPALSGQRLQSEIEQIVSEPDPWRALSLLLGWGAFRLWDPAYRVTSRSAARIGAARSLARWAQDAGLALDATELAFLALLFDQPPPVADRCVRRLAVPGAVAHGVDAGPARALARRLGRAGRWRPSQVAEALRPAHQAAVLGAWLCGERGVRRRIEWFLRQGRGARPLSSGDDVMRAGVARGPLVAQALGMLRDLKLDGRVRTMEDERTALVAWKEAVMTKGDLR